MFTLVITQAMDNEKEINRNLQFVFEKEEDALSAHFHMGKAVGIVDSNILYPDGHMMIPDLTKMNKEELRVYLKERGKFIKDFLEEMDEQDA